MIPFYLDFMLRNPDTGSLGEIDLDEVIIHESTWCRTLRHDAFSTYTIPVLIYSKSTI